MEGVYGRRAFFVSSMTLNFLFLGPVCVSLILLDSSWASLRLCDDDTAWQDG
jgi:hypothetical protein